MVVPRQRPLAENGVSLPSCAAAGDAAGKKARRHHDGILASGAQMASESDRAGIMAIYGKPRHTLAASAGASIVPPPKAPGPVRSQCAARASHKQRAHRPDRRADAGNRQAGHRQALMELHTPTGWRSQGFGRPHDRRHRAAGRDHAVPDCRWRALTLVRWHANRGRGTAGQAQRAGVSAIPCPEKLARSGAGTMRPGRRQ